METSCARFEDLLAVEKIMKAAGRVNCAFSRTFGFVPDPRSTINSDGRRAWELEPAAAQYFANIQVRLLLTQSKTAELLYAKDPEL